jgi:hypothetical protein
VRHRARALDIDLAASDRVPQCHQHAQLVRDALSPALVVDGSLAPVLADHAVRRHRVADVVEAGLAVDPGVLLQQRERVHYRPVGGVVALESQRVQHRRQHLPVVRAVRGAQRGADFGFEDLLVGLRLGHQVAQRLLSDHRVQGRAPHFVGLADRRVGELEKNPLLAADLLQLRRQLLLHPPPCTGVDLMNQGDEQFHQRIGDLRLAGGAQRGQQRHPYVRLRVAEVRGVHLDRPRPPCDHQLLRAVREQPLGQPQLAHVVQVRDLGQQRVQSDGARVTLE